MRISDWSSDVCSSDLVPPVVGEVGAGDDEQHPGRAGDVGEGRAQPAHDAASSHAHADREGEQNERHAEAVGHEHGDARRQVRSEEHTSELQSLMRISYAVFCLETKTHKNDTQATST